MSPDQGGEAGDPVADQALEWFITLRSGESDAATQARFAAWRDSDPRHARAFARVAAVWDMPELRDVSRKIADDLPRSAGVRPARPQRTRRRLLPLAMAAALLVAIGVSQYPALLLWFQADYMTATGAQQVVTLPDGSRMTLDTRSAVALDFADGRRNVRLLQGEAYFDVRHDPARPFRVAGRFGTVEVKGTAFAVARRDDEDSVVLERGAVSLGRGAGKTGADTSKDDNVLLKPGDVASATATALFRTENADIADLLAWREGRYIFHQQPLGRVLDNIRRYYSGTIIVMDGGVNRVPVSGNYRLDDPAEAVRSLADVAGRHATVLPGGIILIR